MADRVCCLPEIGVRRVPTAVKRKVQVLVAVEERPLRVVEEVITGETELKLFVLRLSESETLEQDKSVLKNPGPVNAGNNVGTLLAGRRKREAGNILRQ